jgi:hypothetical protein
VLIGQEGFHFANFHPLALPIRSEGPNRLSAGHRHHVGVLVLLTPAAQVQVAAVDRIGHHPGKRDLRCPQAREHLDRQFWFGLEAHRLRNTGCSTPILIRKPIEGEIDFTVNEGMPASLT